MDNLYCKVAVRQDVPEDIIKKAKHDLKEKTFCKLAENTKSNEWLAIRFREQDSKTNPLGTMDPLVRELAVELEVKPVQNEYVKMVSFVDYKKVKGFWKRLKLLFSRKPLYIEETK